MVSYQPRSFLTPYRQDYKWLAQIYESVRPVGQTGALVWAALGPETIKMIHEHTDINRIRDDIDELIMDEHAIFTLTAKEQEQRAKRLEIDLMGRLRGSHDLNLWHWASARKNFVRIMKLVLLRLSTG